MTEASFTFYLLTSEVDPFVVWLNDQLDDRIVRQEKSYEMVVAFANSYQFNLWLIPSGDDRHAINITSTPEIITMIKMHYSDRESTIRKTVDVVMDIMDINPSALIQHRDMIFKDRKLLAAIIERRLDFVEELRAL